jgi:hypothetical protein
LADFDLDSARRAAAANELQSWVVTYLRGPGNNDAFADGLELRKRYWRGPELIALERLERTCGPEPHMPFRQDADSWETRVAQITAGFNHIEAFPPLIVRYQTGRMLVNDGSHRLAAFETLGLLRCWVIIWYADEGELEHHRNAAVEGPPVP